MILAFWTGDFVFKVSPIRWHSLWGGGGGGGGVPLDCDVDDELASLHIAHKIESWSAIVFPIAFSTFMVLFFSVFMSSTDKWWTYTMGGGDRNNTVEL